MNEKRFEVDGMEVERFILVFGDDGTRIVDNQTGKELYAIDVVDLLNAFDRDCTDLEEENEQLRKIGVMYQGYNPCETCTYFIEDKVCCGVDSPIFCDEMKKNYFVYGLCKKHKQFIKSNRGYK